MPNETEEMLSTLARLPAGMTLAEIREFVDRMPQRIKQDIFGSGAGEPVRISQCVVTAIDWANRQCSVREWGDPVAKTKISWTSQGFIPRVGEISWLLKWGNDSLLLASPSAIMFSTSNRGRTPGWRLRATPAPTINAGWTYPPSTRIPWAIEDFDTDFMFDAVLDNEVITIVTPGQYTFGATLQMNAPGTTVPVLRGLWIANNADDQPYAKDIKVTNQSDKDMGWGSWHQPVTSRQLAAGQQLYVGASQGGGGALGTGTPEETTPVFWGHYVGPMP